MHPLTMLLVPSILLPTSKELSLGFPVSGGLSSCVSYSANMVNWIDLFTVSKSEPVEVTWIFKPHTNKLAVFQVK